MSAERAPEPPQRRFDQRGGIHPPGTVCHCERDFLTLTLEESCQPCPCAVNEAEKRAEERERAAREWTASRGAVRMWGADVNPDER